MCTVAGQHRRVVRLASGGRRGAGEAADEVGGEVLQARESGSGAVEREGPLRQAHQSVESVLELFAGEVEAHPGLDRGQQRRVLVGVGEPRRVEVAVDDRVLEVVHGVGDVVGEVHDLGLDAAHPAGCTRAHPVEDVLVVGVHAELQASARVGHRVRGGPRVLARRVEAGAREVEAVAAPGGIEDLGLEPCHDAQRLRVALESADVGGPVVEGTLAVVPERRVTEVVVQARGVDDIRGEPQGRGELAADLRDLERVGEAVAGEVRGARRAQHLRLRREAAQRRRVQHAGAVAREVVTLRAVVLAVEALGIRVVVPGGSLRGVAHRDGAVSRHCGPVRPRRVRRWPRRRGRASRATRPEGQVAWGCPRDRAGPRRRRRGTARRAPGWPAARRSRRGSRRSRAAPASRRRRGIP